MSNSLAVLSVEIREAHEDACRSAHHAAQRAVDAGMKLLEAKQQLPNGQWLAWLETEAGVPERTAQRYMKLAGFVTEKYATVSDIAEAGQEATVETLQAAYREREVAEKPAPVWTDDQLIRRDAAANTNTCVVANMHDGTDEALIAWAEANDRFVRIDRRSDWGNPFEIPDDGDRAEVIGKFTKFYLPYKDGLLARMPTLRGKVLGCWCHPEECHGDLIAEIVNSEAEGLGTAPQLADQAAEVDG